VKLAPRVIELGKWIEGIAHDGSNLWAAESGQRTIAKVDYRTGRVIERLKVGRLPIAISTIGKDVFTLVATDKVVLKHDRRGKRSRLAALKDCPRAMAVSGTELFVLGQPNCSSDKNRLIRIDSRNGKQRNSANLGEEAQALTVAGNQVWVGHSRGGLVSVVNKSNLKARKVKVSNTEVWALASNKTAVFAGGRKSGTNDDGSIVMFDARSQKERARFSVGERVTQIIADDRKVIAVGREGTIWVLTARDLKLLRTIKLASGKFDPKSVAFVNNDLIISAGKYRGENGAVMVLTNYLPRGIAGAGPNRPGAKPGTGPNRPSVNNSGRPGAKPGQRPGGTKVGQRPGGRPNKPAVRPQRPGSSSSAGFPLAARTLKPGNVRSKPSLKAPVVAKTTGVGQPLTLLARTGNLLENYPWFSIRLGNGKKGYQWGGLICYTGKPISGTRGVCPKIRPQRPGKTAQGGTRGSGGIKQGSGGTKQGSGGNNQTTGTGATGADIVVGVLNLFGALIERDNNKNKNAGTNNTPSGQNLFTETLRIKAGEGPVSKLRDINPDQVAIYTVRGQKGQKLRAELWSKSQNAIFNIYIRKAVQNGATLPGVDDGDYATYFEGDLPSTGNYQIVVGSTGGRASYELVVSLDDAKQRYQASNAAAASNSLLVVGTYSSKTAGSGNIEYNKNTKRLTWTEFCGPTIQLTPNWVKSRLNPRGGGLRPFRLNIKNGEVVGFKSRQNTYVKEAGIMMPGCAPRSPGQRGRTGAASALVLDWTTDPQDSRVNKDYSAVPNAYWATCEGPNYDPNSPKFNNEKAFWDCADEGLRQAAKVNSSGVSAAADPRENKDYSQVAIAKRDQCGRDFPDPAQDKAYYDCMDVGLKAAKSASGGATKAFVDWTLNPQDQRINTDYSAIPDDAWELCEAANADANSPSYNNEKAFWDCADKSLAAAAGIPGTAAPSDPNAPTGTPVQDPRVNTDYSLVPVAKEQQCATKFPNSPADDKGYYDCMDAELKTASSGTPGTSAGTDPNAPTGTPVQDPRVNTDYSLVPVAKEQQCATKFPNSPADDKGYYDCMDAELKTASSGTPGTSAGTDPNGPTGTPVQDPRVNTDYSLVPVAKEQQCATKFPNSPADDKGYYDCMDAELKTASSGTPGTSAGTDPNAPTGTPVQDPRVNTDYSLVPVAKEQQCATKFPNSPADDKGYYDCMDAELKTASSGTPGTTAGTDPNAPTGTPVQDPRVDTDYSLVPVANEQQCATKFPNSPADDKGYYDCMDAELKTASSGTPGTTAGTDPNAPTGTPVQDPRVDTDYSLVPVANEQQCATKFPNSPADDKGYYDCMDAELKTASAGQGSANDTRISLTDAEVKQLFPNLPQQDIEGCKKDVTSSNPTVFDGPGATSYHNCLGLLNSLVTAEKTCGSQHAKGSSGFQNCMNDALTNGADPNAPTGTPVQDSRVNTDYSLVPVAKEQQCATKFPNSPADDKGYYDCMDAELKTASSGTPGTTAPSDPRANTDYSMVPSAREQVCRISPADGPASEKDYYDCMDAELASVMSGAPGTTDPAGPSQTADWTANPQDPRANNDYSAVSDEDWEACGADNNDVNSPSFNNEKAFWDCADRGLNTTGSADNDAGQGQQGDPAAAPTSDPDPRANKDYSLVPAGKQEQCGADFPNSPADDKGYYDCMDQGLLDAQAGGGDGSAGQGQGNADPRSTKDYSSLPMGYFTTCAQNHGEDSSPYFDCLDEGLIGEAINQRVENEFPDLTGEEVQGCATYGYGSDDFFNCLYAVRDNKAGQDQGQPDGGDASGQSDQGPTEQQMLDQAMAEFPDLTGEEVQGCTTYGLGTDDFYNCLYAVRDNKSGQDPGQSGGGDTSGQSDQGPTEQQMLDQAMAEFPDLTGEEVQGCTTYGLGTDDFYNCLYAVRDNKSGQDQSQNDGGNAGTGQDSAQETLNDIRAYCSENYTDDGAEQCYEAIGACVYEYTDHDSVEFDQCAQSKGW
jgi:hypothetical protein